MSELTILSKSIRQLDGLYNLNDLHKASGGEAKHQPHRFLRLEQTKELIAEISKYPDPGSLAVKTTNGRNGGTFVCEELLKQHLEWVHQQAAIAANAIQQRNNYMLNKCYDPDPEKGQEIRMNNLMNQLGNRL